MSGSCSRNQTSAAKAFSERWAIPEHTTDLEGRDRARRHRRRRRRPAELPPRGGGRSLRPRPARRSSARSRSAGPPTRRDECSKRSRRPACSAATSRTSATRRRRSRRSDRVEAGGDRRRHLGPLARDPPGPPQRVVLGRPADRRRRDHRPRLPLHRDHPELRRQGKPAGRGDVHDRHARPPDRRRGQRHRPDPVRVRRDRPVRGQLDVPRRDGPPRRGRRDARHDLAQPLPADRLRDVHGRRRAAATSPRRPKRRRAGSSPSATRCPSSATSTCSRTCSGRWTRAARRGRPSTTATSSTRSWTPAIARRRAGPGNRSSCSTGAAARRRGSRSRAETYEGQTVIKRELLPDGRQKLILKDPASGDFTDRIVPAARGRSDGRRGALGAARLDDARGLRRDVRRGRRCRSAPSARPRSRRTARSSRCS